MLVEIEMKARVTNPDELEQQLRKRFGQVVQIEKEDFYFAPRSDRTIKSSRMFRLRSENKNRFLVTYKNKSINPMGLEVNLENEFSIDDQAAFLNWVGRLDFCCIFYKQKKTKSFRTPDFTIELSEVPPIGYFLEIETICDDSTQQEYFYGKITELFGSLGIMPEQYAPSSYSKLLREARRSLPRQFENHFIHQSCFSKWQQKMVNNPLSELTETKNHKSFEELLTKFKANDLCETCQKTLSENGGAVLSLTVEPSWNRALD